MFDGTDAGPRAIGTQTSWNSATAAKDPHVALFVRWVWIRETWPLETEHLHPSSPSAVASVV